MFSRQSLRDYISERVSAATEELSSYFEETIALYEAELDRQRGLLRDTCPQTQIHGTGQSRKQFIGERLSATGEKICRYCEETIVQYEEEIDRQRRLLDPSSDEPKIQLRGAGFHQNCVSEDEDVDEHENSFVKQKELDPPKLKEERGEVSISQDKEQQDTSAFVLTPVPEKDVDSEVPRSSCLPLMQRDSGTDDQDREELASTTDSETDGTRDGGSDEESCDSDSSSPLGFQASSDLNGHPKAQTEEKSKDVANIYRNSYALRFFSKTESEDKYFFCKECNEGFTYRATLKKHMKIHTGETIYPCDKCDKRFKQRGHLVMHMRTHTGERPFICEECGKGFSRKFHVKTHMKVHTGERPFSCEQCEKTFRHQPDLVIHMRTHTGEKPFLCEACGNSYANFQYLVSHMRVHTGEKPFPCKVCGRRFGRKSHVVIHMRTHTGEKPFSCKECGKGFSLKCNLASHMKTHKAKISSSSVDRADACVDPSTFIIPMTTEAGQKAFSCKKCGRIFSRRTHLVSHIRTHTGEKPASCKECGKSFTDRSQLAKHRRTHSEAKPFTCATCQKRFKRREYLSAHMRTHTEDKPYSRLKQKLHLGRQQSCNMRTFTEESQD